MAHTGETCQQSGVYRSSCCSNTIPLSKGERFPPCGSCRKGTTWILVRPA
mgnify:CR=1 FL=1